jgi:hypothetical protein
VSDPAKKLPWRQRKDNYLEHLRSASGDTLLVSVADKLHGQRARLFSRKVRVVLDFANLLDMPLGMGGDFQHPLPAVNNLSISEAVRPHVIMGGLDIFDHGSAQRLKLSECLAQVLVGEQWSM